MRRIRSAIGRLLRFGGVLALGVSVLPGNVGAVKPVDPKCPSGAGLLYALPGAAEANASAVPVILITSDIPLPGEGRGVLTEMDCARMMEPITNDTPSGSAHLSEFTPHQSV